MVYLHRGRVATGFCGSAEVSPYGQATAMVAFGAAYGGACDLRTINLAQGSILDGTFSHGQCLGACHPNPAEPDSGTLTDVIAGGTGNFQGATGTLTGTVTAAGTQGQVKQSGTIAQWVRGEGTVAARWPFPPHRPGSACLPVLGSVGRQNEAARKAAARGRRRDREASSLSYRAVRVAAFARPAPRHRHFHLRPQTTTGLGSTDGPVRSVTRASRGLRLRRSSRVRVNSRLPGPLPAGPRRRGPRSGGRLTQIVTPSRRRLATVDLQDEHAEPTRRPLLVGSPRRPQLEEPWPQVPALLVGGDPRDDLSSGTPDVNGGPGIGQEVRGPRRVSVPAPVRSDHHQAGVAFEVQEGNGMRGPRPASRRDQDEVGEVSVIGAPAGAPPSPRVDGVGDQPGQPREPAAPAQRPDDAGSRPRSPSPFRCAHELGEYGPGARPRGSEREPGEKWVSEPID